MAAASLDDTSHKEIAVAFRSLVDCEGGWAVAAGVEEAEGDEGV
jgi:hypothetical protein